MAYTGGSQSGTPIAKELVKIELSTVTGGATELIEFDANTMRGTAYIETPVTTPVANSEIGPQVGTTIGLTFVVIGLGTVADWTNLSEIKAIANVCAYVKMTYRDGQSEVLDSGETGKAIMYFSVGQTNENEGVIEAPVIGDRIIANLAKTVS